MARFEYTARDEAGAALSGEVVAATRSEAAKLLRAEGKFVTKLIEVLEIQTRKTAPRAGSNRITEDQVIYFTNQLAVMVDTGVPLTEALMATIEEEPPGAFRKVVEDVIAQVRAGQEFSTALAKYPKVFPRYFSNIIKASEASGLMGTMLQRIASYTTNQRDIKKRIKHAMIYPVAMVTLCIIIAVFLMVYLLPKFTKIFAARHAALPAPTQVLMSTSLFILNHWYWILGGLLVAAAALGYWLRLPAGRRSVAWLKLYAPILAPIYRKSYLTRCMRTMGTMIDAGVSMLETVTITRNVVDNHYYAQVFDRVDEQLQKGNLLSDSLKGTDLFPHAVTQMILAGERSGQMGTVMNRVADFCEQDLDNAIKSATQLIEPILVIIMGSFIGAVVIALLLPIFSLSKVVAGS